MRIFVLISINQEAIKNNFDFVSPFYRVLKRLFFGRSLDSIQQVQLHDIRANESILIIGGGTGEILRRMPSGCRCFFLEKSKGMLSQARRNGDATFIHADFLEWNADQLFDWIICPFFLDCFNSEDLDKVLTKIHELLSQNGRLLVIDFYDNGTIKTRFLLWLMHRFFRLFAGIGARRLVDIQSIIQDHKFRLLDRKTGKASTFSAIYGRASQT